MLFMRLQRLYIRAVGVYRQKFRIFSRKATLSGYAERPKVADAVIEADLGCSSRRAVT